MTQSEPIQDPVVIEARITAEIAAQVAIVREAESRCKAALLPLLAEHGFSRVEIGYDGGGDEGSVCDVTAYRGEDAAELPAIQCEHFSAEYGGSVASRMLQLEDALSAFADNCASNHHSGWENGEGAWGTLAIDVATGTVTLTHNDRFVDYETTETEL